MPVQLFNLRNVPDDEADDIRALLEQHAIDYYETPSGNWGISIPALWLPDEARLTEARALIEDYQSERLARVRAEYRQAARSGELPTLLARIRHNPLQVLLIVAFALAVLYFSTRPFLDLGG